jgi:hypothetical protein
MTKLDVQFGILVFSLMGLAFYAGYYAALKQAKEAIRYAQSVVRQHQRNN